MGQDRALERVQLLAWLQSELVQPIARVAVGRQRLRLPAGTVQRQHQLPVQPLPERLPRNEGLQLADQLRVPTKGEIGVNSILESRQPQILKPLALDPRERLVELGQCRTTPERERLLQHLCGTLGLGAPGVRQQPLEPQQIELLGVDLQARSRAGESAAPRPEAACAAATRSVAPF